MLIHQSVLDSVWSRVLPALAIGLSVVLSGCGQKKNPDAPLHLQCEYQSNPLGIDTMQPRFSWIVNDSRRGAVQSAYQILVAGDENKLKNDKGDVWDSKKVDSDQSALVPFSGSVLKSRQKYFWKVRTWDADGKASPWSETVWWEMGLLNPDDWHAKWIGKTEKKPEIKTWSWGSWIWHPTIHTVNKLLYFRKRFALPNVREIQKAEIKVTADNAFTAWLNGKKLGKGDTWKQFYDFDAKPELRNGDNLIAVSAMNTAGKVCGLIFSLKLIFADGSVDVINSDKSWLVTPEEQKGWTQLDFNDSKWGKVKVVEKFGGTNWGRLGEPFQAPRSKMVRNEFQISKKIRRARVYVTGLGSYIFYVNGNRVGEDFFTPGWTDYPKKVQYQVYNVTDMLKNDKNAVGAILGNMWWSGGLGWRGNRVYSDGPLRLFAQLVVDYSDGTSETFATDESWKVHDSPITENSIYNGESYDARLEMPGWDQPGFDDGNWQPVEIVNQEPVKLVAQQGPTIQVTQEIKPVKVTKNDSGKYIFDMGQNMVGMAQLKVSGKAGTTVTMRFAELLKKDGNIYTENLRSAKATDKYILKGDNEELFQPHFTYHGFRYVEMTGFPGEPTTGALTGLVVHSAAPVIGHFACSNELINTFYKNITWGQRGNMESVPTDCPQRDERLGWMGDAQMFAPTACYNRNMARFFSKWERDIIDSQDEDGAVHDVNPVIVVSGPGKPAWADAVIIIPWIVYQYYGDKRIIERNYDGMAAWVEYMRRHSKNDLYEVEGYGDWIAVEKSPSKPIGSAYFYYSTSLLARMAKIIGREEDAQKYEQLAQKIAAAYNRKHLDEKKLEYEGGTQTMNLLPLAFGITPKNDQAAVIKSVVIDVLKHNTHLTTGFLGTGYILPMLSDYGYHDLAYKLATQTTYPSWGYMVEKGATTVWELWNSDTQGPSMNSRNHFALGSVGEWYYGYLAGIRPDPDVPGFKHTIIHPMPAGDLTWAEASLQTSYGMLKTRWDKDGESLTLKVTIPANTSALVYVPTLGKEKPAVTENGQAIVENGASVQGVKFVRSEKENVVLQVGAGEYEFIVK
ncbi:MAG: family 78 glycoside hydrolase catalytic domain [Calditrichaeota bacterium]|nr:family 78 glycoside hydrolase catalytic domain [Calditrichota bacterium]